MIIQINFISVNKTKQTEQSYPQSSNLLNITQRDLRHPAEQAPRETNCSTSVNK